MNKELQKLDEVIYVVHNLVLDFPGEGYDDALEVLYSRRNALVTRMNETRWNETLAKYGA